MVIFDYYKERDDGSLEYKEYLARLSNSEIVELLDGINHCHYHMRLMEKHNQTKTPLYVSYQKMLKDYRNRLKKSMPYVAMNNKVIVDEYRKMDLE